MAKWLSELMEEVGGPVEPWICDTKQYEARIRELEAENKRLREAIEHAYNLSLMDGENINVLSKALADDT